MGAGEGGNLGSAGKAPGVIGKSVPPDSLCKPDDVDPTGVEVCLGCKPHCWSPLGATGDGNVGQLSPRPARGQ